MCVKVYNYARLGGRAATASDPRPSPPLGVPEFERSDTEQTERHAGPERSQPLQCGPSPID